MSVGKKLIIGFSSIFVLLVVSLGLVLVQLVSIQNKVEEAVTVEVERLEIADEIKVNLALQGAYMRAFLLVDSDKNRTNLATAQQNLAENIAVFKEYSLDDSMKGYITEIENAKKDFDASIINMFDAHAAGDKKKAIAIVTEDARIANEAILANAQEIKAIEKENVQQVTAETTSLVTFTVIVAIIALIIGIGVVTALAIYVMRSISRPLKHAVAAAKEIANGNLVAEPFIHKSSDEVGQLSLAFRQMQIHLKSLVEKVQENAESLSAAAEELSASTEEMSASSDDVANNVSTTAKLVLTSAKISDESAEVVDLTARDVQQIAESSQRLYNNVIDTATIAGKGNDTLLQAQGQMTKISNTTKLVNDLIGKLTLQTKEINNISTVITEITDQTNLLALNAAIEAARAGDEGKGFAVVADEVRGLAEQSKASAEKIVALTREIQQDTQNVATAMTESIRSVEEGVTIINEAGTAFTTIRSAVHTMNNQIETITNTSQQVSASTQQVAASVGEIANGAQNASSSSDTMAQAIREQVATIQNVNEVAMDLAERSQVLLATAMKFKVRV